MRTVNVREANQAFPRLLAEVEAGAEVVIVKRGRPVAKLVPIAPPAADKGRGARLLAFLEKVARPMGGRPVNRDEAHER
jgi:prevent-host-death family protein